MLYTIAVILIVLWLLGLVSSYTMGGFIHILLVIAIIVVVLGFIRGRKQFESSQILTEVKMFRYRFALSLIGLVLLFGSLSGCDNRTGLEKGVDKTADKVKDVAR